MLVPLAAEAREAEPEVEAAEEREAEAAVPVVVAEPEVLLRTMAPPVVVLRLTVEAAEAAEEADATAEE